MGFNSGFKWLMNEEQELQIGLPAHPVYKTFTYPAGNRVTSRKVAGSIPDGVIGFFHRHNPSCRTMVLGSTQPLTEMSTRNVSWG